MVHGVTLIVLALAGGVGAVYAPLVTFVLAGAVFILGLWMLPREGHKAPSKLLRTELLETNTGQESGDEPGVWVTRLVSAYLLIFWLTLIAPLTRYAPREVGVQAAQAAAEGSLKTQVLIILYGLIGLLFLPAALKRFDEAFRWVFVLWMLYLVWGYATLFWTAYTPLTVRGLAAFALVSLGSLGLGAGFYGRHREGMRLLLRHVFVAGMLSALVTMVPLSIHMSQVNILDPTQRLWVDGHFVRYISRPVMLALLVLVMTTILGIRRWRTFDWLWVILLLIPILALKTRGPLLWTMLTLAVVYLLYRVHLRDRVLQVGMLLLVIVGTYVSYFRGLTEMLMPFLTRGDTESTLTLTRRTPLWEFLIAKVQESPIAGVGFSAFWNPENLDQVKAVVGFPVVSAHNGFIEEILATGFIGLALFLLFWIFTMTLAARRVRRGDPLGWLALLFMIFYLILNITSSLLQNHLELPFMVVFAVIGLLAVRRVPERSQQHSPQRAAKENVKRRNVQPASIGRL